MTAYRTATSTHISLQRTRMKLIHLQSGKWMSGPDAASAQILAPQKIRGGSALLFLCFLLSCCMLHRRSVWDRRTEDDAPSSWRHYWPFTFSQWQLASYRKPSTSRFGDAVCNICLSPKTKYPQETGRGAQGQGRWVPKPNSHL